jgi:hypothetical protein
VRRLSGDGERVASTEARRVVVASSWRPAELWRVVVAAVGGVLGVVTVVGIVEEVRVRGQLVVGAGMVCLTVAAALWTPPLTAGMVTRLRRAPVRRRWVSLLIAAEAALLTYNSERRWGDPRALVVTVDINGSMLALLILLSAMRCTQVDRARSAARE